MVSVVPGGILSLAKLTDGIAFRNTVHKHVVIVEVPKHHDACSVVSCRLAITKSVVGGHVCNIEAILTIAPVFCRYFRESVVIGAQKFERPSV